jgi:hypothetical protein
MLDLPDHPLLNKERLLGAGCVKLPTRFDCERLLAEYRTLPVSAWGTGGRVSVHLAAEAVFLRGYAPAEGDKPVLDRPILDKLPYARWIIEQLIPASPLRCLLARLPAGATIAPHVDRAPYFHKTLRIHFPIESHDHAWMMCGGRYYRMRPGEIWAINNSTTHGVWNADATRSRTHMICDFAPSDPLLDLIAQGDKSLGSELQPVEVAQLRSADASA